MPILHENNDKYIYDAIINTQDGPRYTWDENNKVYKYSNTKFPNKNYTKIFDPKTLDLSRGDVIHFGNDSYRNNDKLIFDGQKLIELWTDVDDYGSVPPTFVCGDEPGDFNIGDFEDVIEHNTINWLSKNKLKEIKILNNNDEVYGKLQIQGKVWKICIDIHEDNTFSKGIGFWGSRPFKCEVDNSNIKIHKKATYLIEAEKEENIYDLNSLVQKNNDVHIIHYSRPATKPSNCLNETVWFLFHINNETKYSDMTTTTPNFPIIWRKVTKHYISEHIVFNQERYDSDKNNSFYMEEKENTFIREVTGYTINITMIPSSTEDKLNCVKQFINELIENYDNINKRHPFNNEGDNILQMYI